MKINLKNGTTTIIPVQNIIKITFSETTGIKEIKRVSSVITTLMLLQNYPNPFNPITNIEYEIPKDGITEIGIFNINGQLIKKFNCGFQGSGIHKLKWDGNNESGQKVAGGLYIYQIRFEDLVLSKKMVLIK